MVNPFRTVEHLNLIGLTLALIGGISLSGWIIVGSILSKKGNQPVNSQFFGVTFSVILLLVMFLFLTHLRLSPFLIAFNLHWPVAIWIWLILFSIFAVTLNQIIYLYGVKKVSAVDAGIIKLLEPITGAILAALFLSQPLTFSIILGGILILFANYLVITK